MSVDVLDVLLDEMLDVISVKNTDFLSVISISSGDRLGKLLGDGAGEGNRTLVFSLEGIRRMKLINVHPDQTALTAPIDAKPILLAVRTDGQLP